MRENFEISACYKYMFELLNKVSTVQDLINKIAEFMGIIIVISDIAGKVLFVSNTSESQFEALIEENVLAYYRNPIEWKNLNGRQRLENGEIMSAGFFSVKGNMEGFVYLVDDTETVWLNDMLCQAIPLVMEKSGKRIHSHATTQKRAIAKNIFENLSVDSETLRKQGGISPFILVVFQIPIHENVEIFRLENELIDWKEQGFVYAKEDKIFVLFADVNSEDKEGMIHQKIDAFCRKHDTKCAVTERFDKLESLEKKKYIILETLKRGMRESAKMVNKEFEFYFEMVCSCAVEKIGTARFMESELQSLLLEDKEKGTELYKSLKEYLLLRNNVSLTAKKLFIHRNTMIYRLAKISDMLGVDINESTIANHLLISIMLQEAERNHL